MLLTIIIQFMASLWQARDLEYKWPDTGHITCMRTATQKAAIQR